MFNNIKDRYYDWPLSQTQFETYVNDKYDNINAIHHYEIVQESGSTTSFDDSHKIQVNSTTPGATAVTNYDYEMKLQHKKGRIKLVKPEFIELIVEEFKALIGG